MTFISFIRTYTESVALICIAGLLIFSTIKSPKLIPLEYWFSLSFNAGWASNADLIYSLFSSSNALKSSSNLFPKICNASTGFSPLCGSNSSINFKCSVNSGLSDVKSGIK